MLDVTSVYFARARFLGTQMERCSSIQNQIKEDLEYDQMTINEYIDLFKVGQ